MRLSWYRKRKIMKDKPRNPLKGLGKRLGLHIIIPALYVLIMIVALAMGYGK